MTTTKIFFVKDGLTAFVSNRFDDLNFHQVAENEQLPRAEAFFELLNSRRAVLEYSSEPVPLALIEKAIQTAGTAPSGANMPPYSRVAFLPYWAKFPEVVNFLF
jgi:hypothetical protein